MGYDEEYLKLDRKRKSEMMSLQKKKEEIEKLDRISFEKYRDSVNALRLKYMKYDGRKL